MKTRYQRDTYTPIFIAALSTTVKIGKQPKSISTDGRVKKIYIYTMEYYSIMKKNGILTFITRWMYF